MVVVWSPSDDDLCMRLSLEGSRVTVEAFAHFYVCEIGPFPPNVFPGLELSAVIPGDIVTRGRDGGC